jgi:hypothetical protein
LRGLCGQQQRQGWIGQQCAGATRLSLGFFGIAGGDGDHALRQRLIAALSPSCRTAMQIVPRRAQNQAPEAMNKGNDGGSNHDHHDQHADRAVQLPVQPLQGHRAGALG